MEILSYILEDLQEQAASEVEVSGSTFQTIRVDHYDDNLILDIDFTFQVETVEMGGYERHEVSLYEVFIYEAIEVDDEGDFVKDINQEVKKEFAGVLPEKSIF